jgi:hypothetical protein
VIFENWNSKWFGGSTIEIQKMVYFHCFQLSYFLPKTHPIFLICYKFAYACYYGKSFYGSCCGEAVTPSQPPKGGVRSGRLEVAPNGCRLSVVGYRLFVICYLLLGDLPFVILKIEG